MSETYMTAEQAFTTEFAKRVGPDRLFATTDAKDWILSKGFSSGVALSMPWRWSDPTDVRGYRRLRTKPRVSSSDPNEAPPVYAPPMMVEPEALEAEAPSSSIVAEGIRLLYDMRDKRTGLVDALRFRYLLHEKIGVSRASSGFIIRAFGTPVDRKKVRGARAWASFWSLDRFPTVDDALATLGDKAWRKVQQLSKANPADARSIPKSGEVDEPEWLMKLLNTDGTPAYSKSPVGDKLRTAERKKRFEEAPNYAKADEAEDVPLRVEPVADLPEVTRDDVEDFTARQTASEVIVRLDPEVRRTVNGLTDALKEGQDRTQTALWVAGAGLLLGALSLFRR